MGHTHTPDIIVDPDPHFTINTTTRAITKAEDNKKVSLIQYDHNSERFSFDIDRIIEGHDILDCNRIQIHYINMDSSNRSKRNIGLYQVDDLTVHPEDSTKATFTWLISEQATQCIGTLSFLVSFSCVNEDETLYRWNSSIYSLITIAPGIDNNNSVAEVYADELLKWENYIVDNLDALETELKNVTIPAMVDQRYIERDFATSGEVASIFALSTDDIETINVVSVVQTTGQSTTDVMSQKTVTDTINGLEKKIPIGIDLGSTLTSGVLTASELATLQANEDNYIKRNNQKYHLSDNQNVSDIIVYTYVGAEDLIRKITITISTKAWVMTMASSSGSGYYLHKASGFSENTTMGNIEVTFDFIDDDAQEVPLRTDGTSDDIESSCRITYNSDDAQYFGVGKIFISGTEESDENGMQYCSIYGFVVQTVLNSETDEMETKLLPIKIDHEALSFSDTIKYL